ncbi:uncharacterized protein PHACADRAFT_28030 [Phanerochaete carnosa HHB-10118-sp]|uniref:Uncharacterized protein n=1 Tax=Phanerochaete carnosa (strain HHB-10118-sp) TaxID=650164 RepID=K5X3L5_PHACS|nr:uncharacterized protein PHACADRAFT_28030 [Phanerochaete carnosa HHB-10118-sp]EKM57387.1 hypothetical protein PHACADRAFT_28030 [Phanerochaete carnosa HHB-10118-sp]
MSGSNNNNGGESPTSGNSDQEVQAVIDSLGGIRASLKLPKPKMDISTARRETNAGLRRANSIVASMKKRTRSQKASSGGTMAAQKSSGNVNKQKDGAAEAKKPFNVEAIVLIICGTEIDDEGDIVLADSKAPAQQELPKLEKNGLAVKNWNKPFYLTDSPVSIEEAINAAFPHYKAYEDSRASDQPDSDRPFVLCWRRHQRLNVYDDGDGEEFTAEAVRTCRGGDRKAGSALIIAARKEIPRHILKLWKAGGHKTYKAEISPESPTATTAARGKSKRLESRSKRLESRSKGLVKGKEKAAAVDVDGQTGRAKGKGKAAAKDVDPIEDFSFPSAPSSDGDDDDPVPRDLLFSLMHGPPADLHLEPLIEEELAPSDLKRKLSEEKTGDIDSSSEDSVVEIPRPVLKKRRIFPTFPRAGPSTMMAASLAGPSNIAGPSNAAAGPSNTAQASPSKSARKKILSTLTQPKLQLPHRKTRTVPSDTITVVLSSDDEELTGSRAPPADGERTSPHTTLFSPSHYRPPAGLPNPWEDNPPTLGF